MDLCIGLKGFEFMITVLNLCIGELKVLKSPKQKMHNTFKRLRLARKHTRQNYPLVNPSITSFPLVSPFSIHSTVMLSLSSFRDVTMA